MQTRCPHCNTRFRLTESQLTMAEGYVRCGVCKEVFNALEVDTEELDTEHVPAVATDITADEASVQDFHTDVVEDISQADENDADAEREDEQESYDLFNEEHNETLTHVVPDHLREPRDSHWLGTVFWSLGIALLCASLVLEYVWFNRNRFIQLPQVQQALLEICLQHDCSRLPLRDSTKIELTERNVYSHPEQKNALVINLKMQNTAEFSQPYPVMQVEFSDIRGQAVAARRFSPDEYLGSTEKARQLILPGETVGVSMEIQDPGKQALTYEFNFL